MISVPNSGTDWFCDTVAQTENITYFREFFNPVTNPDKRTQLEKFFGSEEEDNLINICKPFAEEELYSCFKQIWDYKLQFTKENYSSFKIEFFSKIFQTLVFYRSPWLSFPPKRPEVLDWYNAMFASLQENKNTLSSEVLEAVEFVQTLSEQAIGTNIIFNYINIKSAKQFHVPIFEYKSIFNRNLLHKNLLKTPFATRRVADALLSSKFRFKKTIDKKDFIPLKKILGEIGEVIID